VIADKGTTPYHRLTFRLLPQQMELPFESTKKVVKTPKIRKNA